MIFWESKMQEAQEGMKSYQVSILMEEAGEAKLLSDTLRDIGIFAHYYRELDEFWVDVNAQTPDLCIVDVRKMSQGSLLLKNHPKVLNNSLKTVFFYTDATSVLLSSTFSFNHFGYVRKEMDIFPQLMHVFQRMQEKEELQEVNRDLSERVKRLQSRSHRLIKEAKLSYNFENQYSKLEKLMDNIGKIDWQEDFNRRVLKMFSEWEDCQKFSYVELSGDGQKVSSPVINMPGYQALDDMWPARPSTEGMEDFVREMIEENALVNLGMNAKMIPIYGGYEKPDALLFGVFKEDQVEDFQWDLLSERLSYLYKNQILRQGRIEKYQKTFLSPWEMFSFVDDIYFHQASPNSKIVEISFNSLLSHASEKHSQRFHWKAFFADYISALKSKTISELRFTSYGVHSLFVMIDKRNLESDLKNLQQVSRHFKYWQYFEEATVLMGNDLSPQLKLVTPSSVNLIREMNKKMSSVEKVSVIPKSSIRFNPPSLEA